MALYLESSYSLVHQDNASDQPSLQDLKSQLEKGTDETKMDTMRKVLIMMLNGDPMPQLLMHIIRFVMPSKSKPLKKLLYFYYEICPKLDTNGKLKQEMILVWWVSKVSEPTYRIAIDQWKIAMVFETIYSTLMNTSAAIPFDSFANCASPNYWSLYFHPRGYASVIDMPTCGRMRSGRLRLSTIIQRLLFPMPPNSSNPS